jgi:hypothetical protein
LFSLIFLNDKGSVMSILLRSMLVLSVTSLLMVGCGEKQEEAPAEAAPAAAAPVEAPAAEAAATEPGGYVPSAEERVPGITLDADAVEAATAPAAEPAPEAK